MKIKGIYYFILFILIGAGIAGANDYSNPITPSPVTTPITMTNGSDNYTNTIIGTINITSAPGIGIDASASADTGDDTIINAGNITVSSVGAGIDFHEGNNALYNQAVARISVTSTAC